MRLPALDVVFWGTGLGFLAAIGPDHVEESAYLFHILEPSYSVPSTPSILLVPLGMLRATS